MHHKRNTQKRKKETGGHKKIHFLKNKNRVFFIIFVSIFLGCLAFFYPKTFVYIVPGITISDNRTVFIDTTATSTDENGKLKEKPFVATHVKIPEQVKGIYMTACVAATPSFRNRLVKLIQETELNTVIIDIKDYSGTVSFNIDDPLVKGTNGGGCRVSDMREFIRSLHEKGIYVVGRITVFQDPFYAGKHPELAVKKATATSTVWKDHKGISYIDVGAEEYWKYIVVLSKASYWAGFDELNYDYIRFPSDGNMYDIYYPFSEDRIVADPDLGKAEVLREFFAYLYEEMKDTDVILSADLFGMTMTNPDDLNIGQVLEYTAPYFDYIAPMVYPSHYPNGFNGYQNVNDHPYEIVKYSMDEGVRRLKEMANSTTTPIEGRGEVSSDQLRPWLQDNDYPVHYTPEMVRTQIQATYDAGLDSWMLWDASNTYTKAALEVVEAEEVENDS